MVVVFTITGLNYLMVSLFLQFGVAPFPIYICGIKFLGYAICYVSNVTTQASMPLPKSIYHILGRALFSNKYSLKI